MKTLLLTAMLLFSYLSYSQKTFSGIVKDNEGRIVKGCVILVKGTPLGTVTNSEGLFSLNIDSTDADIILIFSLIGYDQIERKIRQNELSETINIVLPLLHKKKKPKVGND